MSLGGVRGSGFGVRGFGNEHIRFRTDPTKPQPALAGFRFSARVLMGTEFSTRGLHPLSDSPLWGESIHATAVRCCSPARLLASIQRQIVIHPLQPAFDLLEEAGGGEAVQRAVIEAEREVHHRADRDHVVDHDRALDDRFGRQDRDLRLDQDRRRDDRAEGAGIVDGEGAAGDVVRGSVPARAFPASSATACINPARLRRSAFLITGTTSPSSSPTATPMLIAFRWMIRVLVPDRVQARDDRVAPASPP